MSRLILAMAALAAAFLAGRRSLGAAAPVEDEMAVVQPADMQPTPVPCDCGYPGCWTTVIPAFAYSVN